MANEKRSVGTDTQYATGTIAIDATGLIVTLSGGTFGAQWGIGDKLVIDTGGTPETRYVLSWDSGTQLTLQTASTRTSESSLAYTIDKRYSTIQAAEDDAVNFSGDDFEVYIWDKGSDYDEQPLINDANPNSMKFTSPEIDYHYGIESAGTVVSPSNNNGTFNVGVSNVELSWLEIKGGGSPSGANPSGIASGTQITGYNFHHLIIHDYECKDTYNAAYGIRMTHSAADGIVHNNWIYDIDQPNASPTVYASGILLLHSTSSGGEAYNNTVHHISYSYGTGGIGLSASKVIQNNIITDVGGECIKSGAEAPTNDHNATDDETATGTGSLKGSDGITAAGEFNDSTGPTYDFGLREKSLTGNAGVDLGTTPTGVNIDMAGADRNYYTETVWSMGAKNLWISSTIGTTSRNHSDIAAWNTSLDTIAAYGKGGAKAKGVCYDDSDFEEDTTIDGGGASTTNLAFALLTVADADWHKGVVNGGMRIYGSTGTVRIKVSRSNVRIERFEINQNARNLSCIELSGIITNVTIAQCILHNITCTSGIRRSIIEVTSSDASCSIINNFLFNLQHSGGTNDDAYGIRFTNNGNKEINIIGNSIRNIKINNTSGDGQGIKVVDNVNLTVKNNLVGDIGGSSGGTILDYSFNGTASSATTSKNGSEDDSSPDGASYRGWAPADNFTSATDLRLKDTNADAYGAADDLTDFYTSLGSNVDIQGFDRHAVTTYDPWDCGAHELQSTGDTTPPTLAISSVAN